MPKTAALSKSHREADFSFGSADRGAGRLMYISKEHCKENAAAYTPGGNPLLLLLCSCSIQSLT